jgi:hypothetical protein
MFNRSLYQKTFVIFLLLFPVQQSICQDTIEEDSMTLSFPVNHNFDAYKLYNARVKLMDKRSFKGILLEANDSTLLVASTKLALNYSSGDYQAVVVPIQKIKRITIRNNADVNQKVAEYAVDGVLNIWEGASYYDMPNTVEGVAGCLMGSILVGCVYGVIRGTISGTKREKYFIDGNYINYFTALYDLQYFSAYKEEDYEK